MDIQKNILICTLKIMITYNAIKMGWKVVNINDKQIELTKNKSDIKNYERDINILIPILCGITYGPLQWQ